ncbi:MAG: leucyl/phenylalanyl-tRNA--protein transferase [Hydrogenophilus sp.]|nr:leucyl/phenylalanyl-tRNA--protein transferase [Hydrogenophilus sp.]
MIPWLDPSRPPHFPATARALTEPNGLLAAGGALTPPWLLTAYRLGIFPWFDEETPILWWSPDPRAVLLPEAFRLHRSLKKRLRHGRFVTTLNTAASAVIRACASTRSGNTWLLPSMISAYQALHSLGFVQSVETWQDGQLVGGLYGVSLGRIFFGESMFYTHPDASKVALARLVFEAHRHHLLLIDCQIATRHLAFMGAIEINRSLFEAVLNRAIPPHPTATLWPPEVIDGKTLSSALEDLLSSSARSSLSSNELDLTATL